MGRITTSVLKLLIFVINKDRFINSDTRLTRKVRSETGDWLISGVPLPWREGDENVGGVVGREVTRIMSRVIYEYLTNQLISILLQRIISQRLNHGLFLKFKSNFVFKRSETCHRFRRKSITNLRRKVY